MSSVDKQHKIWWDEKEEVIRLQVFGDYNKQDAENTANKIAEIKKDFLGKELNFLIDLDKANKPTSNARKIIVEKIYKDPELKKMGLAQDSEINYCTYVCQD